MPFEDREQFRLWSTDMADLHDRVRAGAALHRLVAYMGELVARRRVQPADDVISGLCAAGDAADSSPLRLTPVVGQEGGIVARNLLHGNTTTPNCAGTPTVVSPPSSPHRRLFDAAAGACRPARARSPPAGTVQSGTP